MNLISNTYSISKGNTKRCIKKNDVNINKLIKKQKLINLNTVRYNFSTKKIPFNKNNNNNSNKDSTFNLNNLNLNNMSQSNYNSTAINNNNNYYKK